MFAKNRFSKNLPCYKYTLFNNMSAYNTDHKILLLKNFQL